MNKIHMLHRDKSWTGIKTKWQTLPCHPQRVWEISSLIFSRLGLTQKLWNIYKKKIEDETFPFKVCIRLIYLKVKIERSWLDLSYRREGKIAGFPDGKVILKKKRSVKEDLKGTHYFVQYLYCEYVWKTNENQEAVWHQ